MRETIISSVASLLLALTLAVLPRAAPLPLFKYQDLENLPGSLAIQKVKSELSRLNIFYKSVGSRLQHEQRLSKILTEYAKFKIFSDDDMFDVRVALYFFKLAASFGNPQALYYTALLQEYGLDGTYHIIKNIQRFSARVKEPNGGPDDEVMDAVQKLEHFVSLSPKRDTLMNLYLSSVQGYKKASLALGNKYYLGTGVEKNCTSAFVYLNDVARQMIHDDINSHPITLEKRKLPEELFGKGNDAAFIRNREEEEKSFLVTQFEMASSQHIVELAYLHYFGLKGFDQDLSKAHNLFEIAAELGDNHAKTVLGYMYLYGQGTQPVILPHPGRRLTFSSRITKWRSTSLPRLRKTKKKAHTERSTDWE